MLDSTFSTAKSECPDFRSGASFHRQVFGVVVVTLHRQPPESRPMSTRVDDLLNTNNCDYCAGWGRVYIAKPGEEKAPIVIVI